MQHTSFDCETVPHERIPIDQPEAEWALNIVCVCQREDDRRRAAQVCRQVQQIAGEDAVRWSSWKLADLEDPASFTAASWGAVEADVVIIALDPSMELSPEFHAWIDMWLPRRSQTPGALIALFGAPEPSNSDSLHTRDYLEGVARQGGLEFLLQKCPASDNQWPGVPPSEGAAEQSIHRGEYRVSHWGINE